MKSRSRLWLFRLILASVVCALGAASLFLGAVVWDAREARRAWDARGEGPAFKREGPLYVSAQKAMSRQAFQAEKGRGEFRVFILGSSQAMGTPYVDQNLERFYGPLLGLPNEGGIATWLREYLRRLMPEREIVVVNAAKGGAELRDSVDTMEQIVEIGRPDLLVLLDGNNERGAPGLKGGFQLRRGADLDSALDALTANFEAQLVRARGLADKGKALTYVLTVPNNIRDWAPNGNLRANGPPDEALRAWDSARALDAQGRFSEARELYLRAKDRDVSFLRARSRWNDAIRRRKSGFARPLDMERILFGYAADGIPGKDLFHDYCHMKLSVNRLVAFEIVKRLRQDLKLATDVKLEDASLDLFTARQLRRLYWIKAFRWARSRRNGALGESEAENAEATARRYLGEGL